MNTVHTSNGIAITALGAATSLGCSVASACAAARAGLSRADELKTVNFRDSGAYGRPTLSGPPMVVGHAVPDVGGGFSGTAKASVLCRAALQDLLAQRALTPDDWARTGIELNLSEYRLQDHFAKNNPESGGQPEVLPSETWRNEATHIIPKLLRMAGIPPLPHQNVHCAGHAGIAVAIEQALQAIEEGRIDRCLVGAVDSCLEPDRIQAAAALRVLKTNENPCGFMPGEAAGFALLERTTADAGGPLPLAQIVAIATHQERHDVFSDEPPVGEAIAAAVAEAVAKSESDDEPVAFVVGDLNGEQRRAMDWGHAIIRLQSVGGARFVGGLPLLLPAESFGETGAAVGILCICLAARSFVRGYARGPRAIICLASDDGLTSAIVIGRPKSGFGGRKHER